MYASKSVCEAMSGTSFQNISYKIENWDVAPESGPAYTDIECYG